MSERYQNSNNQKNFAQNAEHSPVFCRNVVRNNKKIVVR